MTIEIFKNEDAILISGLYQLLIVTDKEEKEKRRDILRLLERIRLTHELYENMYGRKAEWQLDREELQ